jgi:hypothetical protein
VSEDLRCSGPVRVSGSLKVEGDMHAESVNLMLDGASSMTSIIAGSKVGA